MTDLQALENDGIQIGGEKYAVVVAAIAGDNLGSHWLGGFVTSFNTASSACRFCVPSKRTVSGDEVAVPCQRTAALYDASVAKLNTGDFAIADGIKFGSVFNKLRTFHVCDPGLPPCVAHDLFEGPIAYDEKQRKQAIHTPETE